MGRITASLLATTLGLGLTGAIPPAQAAPGPLHVAIIWHQHQPEYPKVPGTNIYEQPWVRVHGTKDYYDMAARIRQYPGLKFTVNLTPVLLAQIEDLNRGAMDRHYQLAAKPADRLTAADKAEALKRFFQASPKMMAPLGHASVHEVT